MKLKLRWIGLSLGLLLCSAMLNVAWSANLGVLEPCQDDVQQYCAKVTPGHGRVSLCLRRHENDLSSVCKKRLDSLFEHMMEGREACGADTERLCADVKGGHGRIVACLKRHQDELSDSCKKDLMR